MSLRSLLSVSRFRPKSADFRREQRPRRLAPAPAGRAAALEPLEGRLFLASHLLPVADTYVRNNDWKEMNHGDAPFLWVKTPGNGDERIAFLKFNISDFDAGEVGSAALYLSAALQAPTTPAIQIGVYGVSDSNWVEGNGNYGVRNRGGDAGNGAGQLSGTALGDSVDTDGSPTGEMNWNNQPPLGQLLAADTVGRETFQTHAFDVSAHVQAAANQGHDFVTLAVRSLEPTVNVVRLISKEFAGAGKPQLIVSEAGQPSDGAVRTSVSSADVAAPGGGPAHAVTVTYTSPTAPIDVSRLGNDDITVFHENGTQLPVAFVSVDPPFASSSVTATYHIGGPFGAWDRSDNGVYVVSVSSDAVRDGNGNENVHAIGSFRARIDDATRPTAAISAAPVTTAGGNTYSFTVTYADDNAVDSSTININNVGVSGPGNSRLFVQSVTLSPDADSPSIAATYTILAPGGSWDSADTGTYVITARNTQARDTAGFDILEISAPFDVNIGAPDNERPNATVSASDVTSPGGASHTVTVVYSDNNAIDVETIDAGDISVTGPGGALGVQVGSVNPGGDGTPRSVTYNVMAPGGSWDPTDNGQYTVSVVPNQVLDTSGNGVNGASTVFAVSASTPDNIAPTASISAAGITASGGDRHSITVTYSDNVAINVGTVNEDDITVSGPGGNLRVVGASPDPNANAAGVTVTYTVLAPGGSWDTKDNGTYTVSLNAGNVKDTAGNAAGGAPGSFAVNIAGPDTVAPTASINAQSITSGGVLIHQITVTYSDASGIDASSIGREDLSVVGPDGPVQVQTAIQTGSSATDLVVNYQIHGPNGEWNAGDDGNYSVTLLPGQVRDNAGNTAASVTSGFAVDISGRDEAGPTANVTAEDVLTPGGATHTITVGYTDNGAVNGRSIDVNDITVTRDGQPVEVREVSRTPANNAPSVIATYTIVAPGGTWDTADNGQYTVTVVGGQVTDKKGNGNLGGTATFTVNATVPDAAAPSATVSTSDVTTPGEAVHTILVTYADDVSIDVGTLGTDDLSITGPGGAVLTVENAVVTLTSDGKGATVTYQVSSADDIWDANDNGAYTITINPNSVLDTSGKPVVALPTSFNVAIPPPNPIDPGFGGGNQVVEVGFVTMAATAQPDGRILLVGRVGNPDNGSARGVLHRLNEDGTVDKSFGNQGQVETAGGNTVYHAVIYFADRIYVAGTTNGDFVLAAYDVNGAPVTSFGKSGQSLAAFLDPGGASQNDVAYALSIAPDGKLVVAGSSGENFAFARFDGNGALDPTFAQGGLQVFSVNGHDVVGGVAVQGDHRILAVGSSGPSVVALRLNPNGEIDPTFGTSGLLMVPGLKARQDVPQFIDRSQGLAIQPDGRILIGNHTPEGQFGIVRITANGQLDTSFGSNGIAAVEFGGDDDVDTIIVQDTGQIIAVGTSSTPTGTPLVGVVAFHRDGQLITDFGDGGKLTYEARVRDLSRELHIGDLVLRAFGTRQPDGRIVVGNGNSAPAPSGTPLVRVQVPGARPRGGPREELGIFGRVDGERRPRVLTYTDADGTVITFTMKGGSGSVFLAGDKLDLVINPDATGGFVVIRARGGDGRFNLGDVNVNGQLRAFNAKGGDLSGTMYVTGSAGKMRLGQINGGTVAVAGLIASLLADGLTNARVLSGAILGTDGILGGTGADADTFRQGIIGAIRVTGSITGSVVGAGLNPNDATIGNGNDTVIAGSSIRSISARGGADPTSHFAASTFGSVKLPRRIRDLSADGRFQTA